MTRCVLVTPATRFGSWSWLDKVIRASDGEVEWIVISYGKPDDVPRNARFVSLPEIGDYARLGLAMSTRRMLALNVLYYVPLVPLVWFAALRFRPDVVLGNGVLATALLLPFRRRARVLLAFHGAIAHAGPRWHGLLRRLLAGCDRAFANSPGSVEDLATVVDRDRIVLVPHWADDRFFRAPLDRSRRDRLVLLFVGRLDGEKFAQCLRVGQALARDGLVELRAVGTGPLADQLTGEGLEWLGYVSDVDELAGIYADADVVWAPADTTYVSLPGVEALASGCPLVISDIPAVATRAEQGARVPRDLVPEPVGFVVDGTDDGEAIAVLRRMAVEGITHETREACRRYAERAHTAANLTLVVDEVRGESAPES